MKKNKYRLLLIALIALVIVGWAFARPMRVSGDCMEPAIHDGGLYFVNQVAPYVRQYQVGDIITFKHEGILWYSRVAALETDTIHITEGSVVVNGIALQDTGVQRNWSNWKVGTYAVDKPFQVPAGHVYVLSDNRSAPHDDSRVFGPISKASITGVLW